MARCKALTPRAFNQDTSHCLAASPGDGAGSPAAAVFTGHQPQISHELGYA